MGVNTGVPKKSISLDEKVFFQALTSNDAGFVERDEVRMEHVPQNTELQAMVTRLDGHSQHMARLMYNTAARDVVCYKKVIKPIIIFFRKVIRKFFLKWYIEPVCDQQTEFNVAAQRAVSDITAMQEKNLETANILFERLNDLEKELKAERELRFELEERIKWLEREGN